MIKKLDFTTMKPHVDLFSLVYLKTLKTPKRHFEINGPLVIENFATKKIKLEYLRRKLD